MVSNAYIKINLRFFIALIMEGNGFFFYLLLVSVPVMGLEIGQTASCLLYVNKNIDNEHYLSLLLNGGEQVRRGRIEGKGREVVVEVKKICNANLLYHHHHHHYCHHHYYYHHHHLHSHQRDA